MWSMYFIQIGPLSTLSWWVLQRELRQLPALSESALGLVHLSIIMYDWSFVVVQRVPVLYFFVCRAVGGPRAASVQHRKWRRPSKANAWLRWCESPSTWRRARRSCSKRSCGRSWPRSAEIRPANKRHLHHSRASWVRARVFGGADIVWSRWLAVSGMTSLLGFSSSKN